MSHLVWLITGCSSGFGEQFVHSILSRGDRVIATGRNLSRLQHLSQTGAAILELDITSSQQDIRGTIATAISIYGKIDVLVNNASFIQIGTCEDLEYENFVTQFDTNVFGTIKVTRAVLPHFRQQNTGTMVFIGSLSGWIGHPGCGAYAGSKFALEGVVESLHQETRHLGLRTLLIEPGRFRTNFLSTRNMKTAPSNISDYTDFSKTLVDNLAKENQAQPGNPAKLVEIIFDLVRGEGIGEGKEIPFRLPLGTDVFDDIKAKCEETLMLLKEWESTIKSTDFGDQQ